MGNRSSLGIAAALITILAGGTQVAPAWESENLATLTVAGGIAGATAKGPGKLAALSARQQLRDEVCVAMADGRISRVERFLILADAKRILKFQEYAGFKQSLNRLSPPAPAPARHPVKVARKKPSSMTPHKPSPVAKSSPTPTIPTDVILPDRVVLTSGMR